MDYQTGQYKDRAEKARMLYRQGQIDLNEVRTQANPYIIEVNNKSKELAKKYGVRAKTFNLKAWLR